MTNFSKKSAQAIVAEYRITSQLAHELRSPLTAIAATAESAAMRDDPDGDMRDDLADIQAFWALMAATITGPFALTRSQANNGLDDTCELRDALDSIQHSVPADTGDVRVELNISARISAPAALARRALEPVVDNAIRLADEVSISAAVEGCAVEAYVADDGPGIATDTAPVLFESGRTTGQDRTGLGLALARRVARSVGGDVDRANRVGGRGRGTTVVITPPVV